MRGTFKWLAAGGQPRRAAECRQHVLRELDAANILHAAAFQGFCEFQRILELSLAYPTLPALAEREFICSD